MIVYRYIFGNTIREYGNGVTDKENRGKSAVFESECITGSLGLVNRKIFPAKVCGKLDRCIGKTVMSDLFE